ncbi:zinc-binding dehydrogenase [Streptacidiphilus sp. PAMC 29251]
MIWMTWRQFRLQAIVGYAVLLLIAVYLVFLGLQIHGSYHDSLAHCAGHDTCAALLGSFADQYGSQVDLLGYLLLAVPGAIGVFWGAPLITREWEAGTHRLVWNQSVTRRQWLAAKLGVVGLLSVGLVGFYSLALTWASGPVNRDPAEFLTRLEKAGGPVDVVVDPLWGPYVPAALAALRPTGRLLNVAQCAGAEASVNAGTLRHARLKVLGLSGSSLTPEQSAAAYAAVAGYAAEGRFDLALQVHALEDVAEAWAAQAGSPGRKLVLRP